MLEKQVDMKVLQNLSEENYKNSEYFREILLKDKVFVFNKVSVDAKKIQEFIVSISDSKDENLFSFQKNQEHVGLKRVYDNLSDKDYQDFIKHNWHVDNSYAQSPHSQVPVVISMHMRNFQCSNQLGKTIFVDTEKMLNDAPKNLVEWMSNSFIVNLMGYDHNKGMTTCYDGLVRPLRVFPLINTHPIINRQHFLYISSIYAFFPENKSMEKLYKEYADSYLSDRSNWMTVDWAKDEMVVWDNRSVVHSFEPGWSDGQRVFDRYQCDFHVPFYDKNI
jgi:alpha-ketoglutarate-dependent taurine dioxygenase